MFVSRSLLPRAKDRSTHGAFVAADPAVCPGPHCVGSYPLAAPPVAAAYSRRSAPVSGGPRIAARQPPAAYRANVLARVVHPSFRELPFRLRLFANESFLDFQVGFPKLRDRVVSSTLDDTFASVSASFFRIDPGASQ